MTAKRLLAAALLLSIAGAAQAHSTRVIATRPVVEPGRKTTVFIGWGHLLPVDELVAAEDMAAYRLHPPSGSATALTLSGRSLQANEPTLEEPGVYQVEATRKPSIFTAYTKADGSRSFEPLPKDEVDLPEGAKLDLSARSVQCAKALILCGPDAPAGPIAPLGHPLEIVLESTPGPKGFSPDEPVRARVLFHGDPVAGIKVFAASTSLNPSGAAETSVETDSEGRVSLDLYEPGTWVLEAYHNVDAPEEFRTSFDSDSFLATFSIPVAGEE
ncbi:DUF4198 domain-containing protein [Tautonia sociabilis]|uniref:DUF4198 domain-containing protein n=1 Tax=Tautonia sociabilis TaxID=2080755 RepID=A0A432MDK7_9BACT|nr:DUF4198 domain-containing protein [Tautonia sociabilis]RUL82810.1 DUF4198 domain-containing protein [Tautonia sociabilis]